MKIARDAFGRAMLDYYLGKRGCPVIIERRDGRVDVDNPTGYFIGHRRWWPHVQAAMRLARVGDGYDKVKQEAFCRPLGGAIEFGERSEDALRREIKEEISADVAGLRLLGAMENLFVCDGEPGHEIVLVYDGQLTDPAIYERGMVDGLHGVDDGIPFTATGQRLDEFGPGRPPLYPDGLKELLMKNP